MNKGIVAFFGYKGNLEYWSLVGITSKALIKWLGMYHICKNSQLKSRKLAEGLIFKVKFLGSLKKESSLKLILKNKKYSFRLSIRWAFADEPT